MRLIFGTVFFLFASLISAQDYEVDLGGGEEIDRPYDDIEESEDQPVDKVVNIVQENPHSNAVHVAHSNARNSDITVEMTMPNNVSVHVSINNANGAKVRKSTHGSDLIRNV